MKYLYIDESIDGAFFVVGGILTDSENDLFLAYSQFKKQILNIPLTRKQKEKITYEFKSALLDRIYPRIKRKLLYKLSTLNCSIVYSYKALQHKLNQTDKEKLYIVMLSDIIKSIKDDVVVVTFDSFGNSRFENLIIREMSKIQNVKSIRKEESFNNKGLQFADNVCGVIRKHLSNRDYDNYFEIIRNKTLEIQSKKPDINV
ncbi:MAG: DUF3800 domain-containing protein [Erysipelotrichaceae bacterium]|nr:DUF3800 domain-containing protein [Erysipelotrichaceae bacterium]